MNAEPNTDWAEELVAKIRRGMIIDWADAARLPIVLDAATNLIRAAFEKQTAELRTNTEWFVRYSQEADSKFNLIKHRAEAAEQQLATERLNSEEAEVERDHFKAECGSAEARVQELEQKSAEDYEQHQSLWNRLDECEQERDSLREQLAQAKKDSENRRRTRKGGVIKMKCSIPHCPRDQRRREMETIGNAQ